MMLACGRCGMCPYRILSMAIERWVGQTPTADQEGEA
jgi:hypothetical protein